MENQSSTLDTPDLTPSVSASNTRMLIFTADTLRVLTCSDALRHELQYTQEALSDMRFTNLLCHPGEETLSAVLRRESSKGIHDFRLKAALRRQDGSTLPVTLKLIALPVQPKTTWLAIVDSTTSSAMGQVSSREERLEHIAAQVPGLLFQMRQGPNGLIQFSFLSEGCENLLGLSPEILYANARQFFALIVEEDRESWATQLRASAERLDVLSWEGRLHISAWNDTKWIGLRARPEDDGNNGIQWTGLMTNISNSKQHEHSLRQSHADLSDLCVFRDREQEEEHAHICQTLHDDLGGNLAALKMMVTHLWEMIPVGEGFSAQKAYIDKLITRSIRSVQQITTELRPTILDAGLVASLNWLTQEQENQTGIHYEFRCNTEEIRLDPTFATILFRIAQAACANIREYAQASAAEVHLYDGCSELLMEIIDNGKGTVSPVDTSPLNYRLREMRERVSLLGGSFSVAMRAGKGTLISLRVPLPASAPTPD